MPRIRCLYLDCNFLDDSYCTAPNVEIDPDLGCATYVPMGEDVLLDDEEWEEDDDYAGWETEDIDLGDDDDEIDDDDDDADADWIDD